MNRFNHREYSQFKNSLVSTYLSYCEYYRLTVIHPFQDDTISPCLIQAPFFHPGECAELCLVQEVYGSEALHEDAGEDGLPVHLWHLAGRPVWSCSNQAQGNLVGCSSWRNLASLSRAPARLLSSGELNFSWKWLANSLHLRLVTCLLKWKASATTRTPCGG